MIWWIIKIIYYYKSICYNYITVEYYKSVLVTGTHSLSLPVQSQIFLHHFSAASKPSKFFVHSKWCKISSSPLMAKDFGAFPPANTPFPVSITLGWLGEPLLLPPQSLFCYSCFKTLHFWVFQMAHPSLAWLWAKIRTITCIFGEFLYSKSKYHLHCRLIALACVRWGDASNLCDKCHYLSCQAEQRMLTESPVWITNPLSEGRERNSRKRCANLM